MRKIVYQCTREDHPRRCGENISTASHAVGFPGSPPQVRGKPISDTPSSRIWGITPAGAGKTAAVTISIVYPSDHPRRCGENFKFVNLPILASGSPPQVRGKPRDCPQPCNKTRITPAGAGKTPSALFVVLSAWDHPRRCGENVNSPVQRLFATGSPPQVRGKPAQRDSLGSCARITPAGAGKTVSGNTMSDIFTHHPRRCGENQTVTAASATAVASPPQVRGKRIESANVPPYDRITPAGAGKTNCPARRARLAVDHPRRCGENMIPPCRLCVNTGSPPQVRGKRDTDGQTADVTGITPADAGKTTN